MRDMYHGTIYENSEIDIKQGKGYKDFGKGFYATVVKSHAESTVKKTKTGWKLEKQESCRKIRNLG